VVGGGHDTLYGGNHNDKLIGKGGHDQLFGGDGDDWLNDGGRRDVITGMTGRDSFVFRKGHDTITNFEDSTDQVLFRAGLVGDAALSDIIEDAKLQGGDTVLDFGNGHTLTIFGLDDPDILVNDLSFL
jgi:serralysin